MSNNVIEKDINKVLNNVMNSAMISSEYTPGDNISLFLEHVVNNIIYNSKIEDLWGPVWSLFLAVIADRMRPVVSPKIALMGIKDVLSRMVGHSDTTPGIAMAAKLGLPVDDILMSIDLSGSTTEQHLKIASVACNYLCIATPVEVAYLRTALDDTGCMLDLALLYKLKPDASKHMTRADIPMLLALKNAKLTAERTAIRAEQVAEQAEQVAVRYQQEIAEVVQSTSDIELIAKQIEEATVRFQQKRAEATRATSKVLETSIEAERNVADATRGLLTSTPNVSATQPTQTYTQTAVDLAEWLLAELRGGRQIKH